MPRCDASKLSAHGRKAPKKTGIWSDSGADTLCDRSQRSSGTHCTVSQDVVVLNDEIESMTALASSGGFMWSEIEFATWLMRSTLTVVDFTLTGRSLSLVLTRSVT